VYGTARFSVKPEALNRCRPVIQEFVSYVRAREPGTKLYLSLQDRAGGGPGGSERKPSPLDILDERFARGEISQEEYEERRRTLIGSH